MAQLQAARQPLAIPEIGLVCCRSRFRRTPLAAAESDHKLLKEIAHVPRITRELSNPTSTFLSNASCRILQNFRFQQVSSGKMRMRLHLTVGFSGEQSMNHRNMWTSQLVCCAKYPPYSLIEVKEKQEE